MTLINVGGAMEEILADLFWRHFPFWGVCSDEWRISPVEDPGTPLQAKKVDMEVKSQDRWRPWCT